MADFSRDFCKNGQFFGLSVGDLVHRYILQMIDSMIVAREIGLEKPGFQGEGGWVTALFPVKQGWAIP
jgi:hypothetical protein